MYRKIIRPMLYFICGNDAEKVHDLAIWSMSKPFWKAWKIYGFVMGHLTMLPYQIKRLFKKPKDQYTLMELQEIWHREVIENANRQRNQSTNG